MKVNRDLAGGVETLLERLAEEAPRQARVVEMFFFGGLGFAEIARQLDVPVMTVTRDWRFCRAWLWCALSDAEDA